MEFVVDEESCYYYEVVKYGNEGNDSVKEVCENDWFFWGDVKFFFFIVYFWCGLWGVEI